MRARAALLALTVCLPAAIIASPRNPCLGPSPAEAAVSMAITLDELLSESTCVVVATSSERQSLWEDTEAGRRIVTYTRLDVDRSVVGQPGSSVWVRTLGGTVGNIGQYVSGEAQLLPGTRSLLFLRKSGTAVVVTAMAQGHFPVLAKEGEPPRLLASPDAGAILARRGPSIAAREVLVGATLEQALGTIEEARRAREHKQR
jgi:hypothetical protein